MKRRESKEGRREEGDGVGGRTKGSLGQRVRSGPLFIQITKVKFSLVVLK